MKRILLALFFVCFTGALSAQMKIVLEKDVDKINSAAKQNKQTEATNKRTFSEEENKMEANNNVTEKKSQSAYANNKTRAYKNTGKKKSYSDIQNERQRRRKENKLSDVEEIQAQLKELEKVE